MLDSVMGVLGLTGLLLLVLGVVNPIIAVVPLMLVGLFLGVRLAGRAFRHAGVSASAGTAGPGVPSTREASYEPIADPAERG